MTPSKDQNHSRARRARALGRSVGLVVLLATVVSVPASAKVVERIVAVVNKQIILLSELRHRVAPMLPQLQQLAPQLRRQRAAQMRKQILGQMIDQKLLRQQARKLKIKVKDKELERAIKDVMRKNNLTREQLVAALHQEGKTLQQYREQILRPQLLRLKVLNVTVRSRVSVNEDEIKALYQKNMRALGVETKVRARHIFFELPAKPTSAQLREQRQLAEKVRRKVAKGEAFAELAKKYSDDAITRGDGGDLGYFSRGTLPANVEDVVFAMKKGEVKGPLRTERGLHVIQVTDRKESSARPYSEVRKQLRSQIYAQKMEKVTKAWLKELRKKAYVDIRL